MVVLCDSRAAWKWEDEELEASIRSQLITMSTGAFLCAKTQQLCWRTYKSASCFIHDPHLKHAEGQIHAAGYDVTWFSCRSQWKQQQQHRTRGFASGHTDTRWKLIPSFIFQLLHSFFCPSILFLVVLLVLHSSSLPFYLSSLLSYVTTSFLL